MTISVKHKCLHMCFNLKNYHGNHRFCQNTVDNYKYTIVIKKKKSENLLYTPLLSKTCLICEILCFKSVINKYFTDINAELKVHSYYEQCKPKNHLVYVFQKIFCYFTMYLIQKPSKTIASKNMLAIEKNHKHNPPL